MRPSKLFNPVGWFEIYVDDLERAGRFYAAVLERQLNPASTDGTFEALEFQGQMPSALQAMESEKATVDDRNLIQSSVTAVTVQYKWVMASWNPMLISVFNVRIISANHSLDNYCT